MQPGSLNSSINHGYYHDNSAYNTANNSTQSSAQTTPPALQGVGLIPVIPMIPGVLLYQGTTFYPQNNPVETITVPLGVITIPPIPVGSQSTKQTQIRSRFGVGGGGMRVPLTTGIMNTASLLLLLLMQNMLEEH